VNSNEKVIYIRLVLLMVVVSATMVCGKAQKVDLVPCPMNYPETPYPPGGGFVIFNNSSGTDHNLELTVSLKGVEANTEYDIYLFVDGVGTYPVPQGSVTSNKKGNVNFHMNVLLAPGEHTLALDVTLVGSGDDVYETPGIHSGEGTVLEFK